MTEIEEMEPEEEEEEEELELPLSHSYISNNTDLHRVTSKFSLEEYLVREYEDKLYYFNRISGLPMSFVTIGYIVAIVIAGAISPEAYGPVLGISEQLYSQISGVLIFGIIVLGFILWVIKKIVKSRIDSMELSHSDAVYHNIVNAIKEYQADNHKNSKSYLESAQNLMKYKDESVFNPNTKRYFDDFVENNINEPNDTDMSENFPKVANIFINELAGVKYIGENRLRSESTVNKFSDDESTTLVDIIVEDINERIDSPTLRRIWPYLVALPVVLLVYNYVGAVISQIIALFYIGMVEKLHNPEID